MDQALLRLFLWVVQKTGISGANFEQVKIIASTKLLMDGRRTPATWKVKQQQPKANKKLAGMIVYGLMSIFFGVQVFIVPSMYLVLSIFHGYILFFISMLLITDFSNVLLDTRDNQILMPKPVSGRTILLSRTIHISIYLFRNYISLCTIPIIFYWFYYGWIVGLGSIFTSLLMLLFSLFSTYILYGILFRFASEQKIKDIIGYFQIVLTIVIMAAFQILPRLLNFDEGFTITPGFSSYFIPPCWMAIALEAFAYGMYDQFHLIHIVLALIVPFLAVFVVLKFIAPGFNKKIAALAHAGQAGSVAKIAEGKNSSQTWLGRIQNFVCTTETQKAGFQIFNKIAARDKGFKIAFYPSFAYIFVMIFAFMFKSGNNIKLVLLSLSDTSNYLWLAYIPVMAVSSAMFLMPYHEKFEAGWVYQSAPLARPGELVQGALKAIIIKFLLPIFFIMFGIALYFWGYKIIDDFLLGFCNTLLIMYVMLFSQPVHLPWSKQPNTQQQSGRFLKVLLQYLIIGILVAVHYLATRYPPATLLCILPVLVGVWLYHNKLNKLPWQKISV